MVSEELRRQLEEIDAWFATGVARKSHPALDPMDDDDRLCRAVGTEEVRERANVVLFLIRFQHLLDLAAT